MEPSHAIVPSNVCSSNMQMSAPLGVQVFHRVPIQPRDAREASDVFYTQAQGDILLNYENEVFMTNNSYAETGQDQKILPYIVPQNNVRVSSFPPCIPPNLSWFCLRAG